MHNFQHGQGTTKNYESKTGVKHGCSNLTFYIKMIDPCKVSLVTVFVIWILYHTDIVTTFQNGSWYCVTEQQWLKLVFIQDYQKVLQAITSRKIKTPAIQGKQKKQTIFSTKNETRYLVHFLWWPTEQWTNLSQGHVGLSFERLSTFRLDGGNNNF